MKFHLTAIAVLLPALSYGAEPVPDRAPLRLSLKRAVDLALSREGSTRVQLSDEQIKQARARVVQARAALLPDIEASAGSTSQTRNLNTLGLSGLHLPILNVLHIPRLLGPFDVFDARATLVQNVFDLSSIRRLQASHDGVGAATAERENTDDSVSTAVAKAYMAGLRADAELDAIKANVVLAEAIVKQAENQKAAGSGTGIEVTRARVELLNQTQRQLVAANERNKAHLQLLRAMNLRLDTQVELTDVLGYTPMDAVTYEQALKQASETRSDLKAQERREDGARLSASATRMERLPSVAAFADYGTTGTGLDSAVPTRTYGYVVRFPFFDGFRRDARRVESNSIYKQERIRSHDLKDQIDLEVRLSIDALRSAEEQIKVSSEALTLAESELTQARRRYSEGVATGLEVTDAQSRLARARDNHVAALFAFNLARVDYGQATGTIRQLLD